ncbi:ATP-binding protein [Streptomyces sp. Je 1-79]|uniref:sensor histidine kinase n=1 Tax=Streptomyces sp. Je 1-79 TaxID=2943847 RepID=UPI0021A839F9|nr:ATP-binding protein [Streptomyces sp. Je 1-79]MCT4353309.1 ATP-binding protein [Streptomyces sp. Je 1-79]
MSQLRAPAARSERREGGRHGRSGARSASGAGAPNPARQPAPLPAEARIRPQLLRTSVLPAVAVALGGAAAVLFTIRSTGATPTPGLWAALTGAAALTVASVTAAALGADRVAKSVLDRCNALRRSSARGQSELRTIVEQLRRGEGPPARPAMPPSAASGDEFDLLGQELSRSHEAAVAAVVQASRLSSSVGNEQKVEVFVNLARRLQSLVHREIQLLDELENEVEDPELLKGLFHVDHLATRIRRHAENLAVLGGAISRRQWSNPVTMTEVLRSSIAEVEQYPRVKLVPPIDGTLRGHAVADVIHLLAELVENATLFSAPHTTVLLRAQYVTAGLAIEVEDRGLGMPVTEQNKMNALLADPDQVNVAHLLQDGRIGLFVVSALARRHGIAVRLQSNIYGGIQAVLVLPKGLLGADPEGLARNESQTAAVAASPSPAQAPQMQQVPQAHGSAVHAAPQPAPAPVTAPVQPPAHTPAQPPAHTPAQPPAHPPVQQPPVRTPVQPPAHPPVRTPAHAQEPASAEPPHRPLAYTPSFPLQQRTETVEHAQPPGRPLLPKRRAQEHLVPQLRDEPAARKTEEHALHDPGLMAAFQRGIGLAESQPAPHQEPPRPGDAHKE